MHNLRSPVVLRCTPRSSGHHVLMFSFNSIIIRVWSYGGLRSSPLSRNRELMQRIARIGYLKLGVICKCRVRLALGETRKREELPHPPPPLSFSPLLPSPLAHCQSLLFSFSFCELDLPSSWRRTKTPNNLCNALRYVFLLLFLLQREFFLPCRFFLFLLSVLYSRTRLFRQINNSSRLHAL